MEKHCLIPLFLLGFFLASVHAQTPNTLQCYTGMISSCNPGFTPVIFISGQDNAHASETADQGYVPVCCKNMAGSLSVSTNSTNPACATPDNNVFLGLYSTNSSTPATNSHGEFNAEADGSYDWANSANANRQLCLNAGSQPMSCWRSSQECDLQNSACVLAIANVSGGESGHVAACETYAIPGAYDYVCCSTSPLMPTQPGIHLVIDSLSLIQQPAGGGPSVEVPLASIPAISVQQTPIAGIKARIKNLGMATCPNATLRFWFANDDGQTILPTTATGATDYTEITPVSISAGDSVLLTLLDNQNPVQFAPENDLAMNSQNLAPNVYLLSVDAYCDTVRHNSKRAFFSVFNTFSIPVPELPFWLVLLIALAFAGVLTAKNQK
ncbi:MAG: hypothetical protein V1777_02865 [Candidatus Micrarchaeota archaeon]